MAEKLLEAFYVARNGCLKRRVEYSMDIPACQLSEIDLSGLPVRKEAALRRNDSCPDASAKCRPATFSRCEGGRHAIHLP